MLSSRLSNILAILLSLSVIMNLLTFTQSFSFGVKRFKAFRKHLMTDPKKLGRHEHTNPHAIPFKEKQQLLKVII